MINSVDLSYNLIKIKLENAMMSKLCESCDENKTNTGTVSFDDVLKDTLNPTAAIEGETTIATGESTPAGSMKASDNLLKFVESHEGFASSAYNGIDYWNNTIGYGHVITPGEKISALSETDAQSLLKNDLKSCEDSVNKEFAGTNLTQNQFDALVSFSYNLGTNIWSETPKLVSDIKSGASADVLKTDFENCGHVAGQLVRGLVNRRDDEWNLFTNGVYGNISNIAHI